MKKLLIGISILILIFTMTATAENTTMTSDELWAAYRAALQVNDNEVAMNTLEMGAAQNDGRCIMNLGLAYLEGSITNHDYEKAFEYLQISTDMGDRKAPRYIAQMYANGQGTEVDFAKAAAYYEIAVAHGDITSGSLLGRLYQDGQGVEQSYEKAIELYTATAAGGIKGYDDAVAVTELAHFYAEGLGIEKNMDKAIETYQIAADYGHIPACEAIVQAQAETIGLTATQTATPKGITALTQVYGNGQRIYAVAIEFEQTIRTDSLFASSFHVEGRKVLRAYANVAVATAEVGVDGCYVILELDITDDEASVYEGGIVNGGNGPTGSSGTGVLKTPYAVAEQLVTILGDQAVLTTDSNSHPNTEIINLVADDFTQHIYNNEASGEALSYNLYIPADYDSTKTYPLVLFMADASANGNDVLLPIRQGNGGTVFAQAQTQAKNPCFVIVPQFGMEGETNTTETVFELIDDVANRYSIDMNRIYSTGQSQGCIKSITLACTHPNFFAGLLLVAGQPSDTDDVSILKDDNIWIIVSEGDKRGYPGMTTMIETMQAADAAICSAAWDANMTSAEYDIAVDALRAEGTNVKFTTFIKGSTWDGDPLQDDPNEHNSAMHYAYNIESVRDWLFEQVLGEVNP